MIRSATGEGVDVSAKTTPPTREGARLGRLQCGRSYSIYARHIDYFVG